MIKVTKNQAKQYHRAGLDGHYYLLPTINGGTTVLFATFTGEHGERTIGERSRVYYILEGRAKFEVNKEQFEVLEGDIVAIPAHGTYNFWPISKKLDVWVVLEYLDFQKLTK